MLYTNSLNPANFVLSANIHININRELHVSHLNTRYKVLSTKNATLPL